MGLKLHGLALSTCTARVATAIYEKGQDFELVAVNLTAGEHKQPSFLAKNVRYIYIYILIVYVHVPIRIESIGLLLITFHLTWFWFSTVSYCSPLAKFQP